MPYRLIVNALCSNGLIWTKYKKLCSHTRDLCYSNVRLLIEYLTHYLVVSFTDLDRPGPSAAP